MLDAACLTDQNPRCMHRPLAFPSYLAHSYLKHRDGHIPLDKTAVTSDTMADSTPSPSDTCGSWSSSFSDCGTSTTSVNSTWNGREVDVPVTPAILYATLSVTPAPGAVTSSPSSSGTSSASNSSPMASRGRRYAQDGDWTRHRERIVALYEHNTLERVVAIMAGEHKFFATKRMYKSRFKEWGVKKNVTAADVDGLLWRVKKHVQQEQQGCGAGVAHKMTLLDIGDELDVKRIQKYMKRNPTGLEKLRADPKRPLDVIKALTVDNYKGRSGRTKVSIPTAKLEKEQIMSQFHISTPPPSESMVHWPAQTPFADSSPVDMARLLQIVVDQEFNVQYAHSCYPMPVSPAASYQLHDQSHSNSQSSASPASSPTEGPSVQDELMLRFVLKIRFALILLDDGLAAQAFDMVNICLHLLSARLQMMQGADGRAICTVLLYAMTAALDLAVNTNHADMLHMLLHHISSVCAMHQPLMADFTRRLSELGRFQQIAVLELARHSMSRVAFGYAGHENIGLEMYSRTVDISIGQSTPEEKLMALQAMSAESCVQKLEGGAMWMEARVALSVPDAPWAAQQQGLWSANSSWNHAQENKSMMLLRYISDRLDWHKAAGDWGVVEKWASEAAWTSEITLGHDHEVTRKFRDDVDSVKSPIAPMLGHGEELDAVAVELHGHVHVSAAPSHPHSHSKPLLDTLSLGVAVNDMSFKQERSDALSMGTQDGSAPLHEMGFKEAGYSAHSNSSWEQTPKPERFDDMTLPSLWDTAGGDNMGGGAGGLYDGSF